VQKVHVGLNDAGGTRSLEGGTPRKGPRYRRRGSVTKYSLNTVEDVKKEYNEHEDMINQFRNQALVSSTADHSKPSYGANSVDSGDLSSDGDDLEKKKKNKKGFMKFGRSNKESSNWPPSGRERNQGMNEISQFNNCFSICLLQDQY